MGEKERASDLVEFKGSLESCTHGRCPEWGESFIGQGAGFSWCEGDKLRHFRHVGVLLMFCQRWDIRRAVGCIENDICT